MNLRIYICINLTFKILGTQSQYFTLLYIRNRFYRIQLPLNTWERCISRLFLPPLSFETFPLKDLKKSLTNIIKERKYITRLVPLHESGRSSSSFMNICVNNQGTQVNTLRCLMQLTHKQSNRLMYKSNLTRYKRRDSYSVTPQYLQ